MIDSKSLSRRDFMKKTAIAGAALSIHNMVFSQSTATLKVGVIGCGGRGTGAATDSAAADAGVQIWAMGDVFADRLEGSAKYLGEQLKDRFKVTKDRMFTGFDAYKGVLESGCDIVILATPPGFRPQHFEAAVKAGKHIFMEKPVATDAAGVRQVIEASKLAKSKSLAVVAGTQRRHDPGYVETIKRIQDGQMGDITAMYAYWNQGGLWMNPRKESWSDMEWQLRNWLYFTWLSGDHICEQHIHNIDVCNWTVGAHPVKAISLAGRQVRTDPAYGHIFDHFATEYEYANGVRLTSMCRQIDGTVARVSEHLVGSKGTSNPSAASIKGQNPFRYEPERPNPYVQEHVDLIASIKSGKPLNEGIQVAESTLTAIMGRMAAYTGQEITWEQAMASQEVLVPANPSLSGKLAVAEIAMPGKTKFA